MWKDDFTSHYAMFECEARTFKNILITFFNIFFIATIDLLAVSLLVPCKGEIMNRIQFSALQTVFAIPPIKYMYNEGSCSLGALKLQKC